MKICWDNLNRLEYRPKLEKWLKRTKKAYIYYKISNCKNCKKDFLYRLDKKGNFCSIECFHKYGRWSEYKKNLSRAASLKIGNKNPNYNNKWTKEQKIKLSKKLKGIGLGEKRPEHSIKMCGSGNPNWRNGISFEPYCQEWKDNEYKQSIRKNACKNSLCWKTSENLCLHHIDYNKKNCKPKNLITLCFSCNARANFNRKFWQKHYKKMR